MQVVIRKYTGKGAKELFDVLERNKADLQNALRSVRGFVSYTLARTGGEGGFSVTVCQDKTGIDESVKVAKDWIAKNAPNVGAGAPEVTTGNVLMQMT